MTESVQHGEDGSSGRTPSRLTRHALALPIAYAAFGIAWILASDLFLASLRLPREIDTRIAVAKGWIFVGGSTILIALLARNFRRAVGGVLRALENQLSETTRAREEATRLAQGLEEEVRLRTRHLETAVSDLGRFADSVSHDLRAPVRSVAGMSRIVLEDHGDALPPEARASIRRIEAAAGRMNRMIDGLLDLARCGRQDPVLTEIDGPAHDRLVSEIWTELVGLESGRAIDADIRPLPGLRCDPRLLETVWRNLLGNALKYTRGAGRARISVDCDAGWFRVRDDGVGFDPSRFREIFTPFRRYHDPALYEGEGIGLALVRRIVEHHGGTISIDSAEGKGTTVRFRLFPSSPA